MGWRDIKVDELELSVRATNTLKHNQLDTIGAIVDYIGGNDVSRPAARAKLMNLEYAGSKTVNEILEVLHVQAEQAAARDPVETWLAAPSNRLALKAVVEGRAAIVPVYDHWRHD